MKKGSKRPQNDNFRGFVNYELSAEQKALLKKKEFPAELFDSELVRLNESGYKASFSFDNYSQAFACFIAASQEDNENYGWFLTGRGSSPIKALKQVLYKHYELFQESWPKKQDLSREEIDD